MRKVIRCAVQLLSFAALPFYASGLTLYYTDFEEFNGGNDKWAGTNGWVGTSTGWGVHGIDTNIIPALGKTAFLGFNRPQSTLVRVFRPVYDPAITNPPAIFNPILNAMPIIEFEALVGIEDSTNGRRDSFFFTFYHTNGNLMASVRFSNEDVSYGLWRLDGTNQFDTGIDFVRGELHDLRVSINVLSNQWDAYLDSIPLFTGAQFNATGQTQKLGFVSAEWQLGSTNTANYGNNWMLVADWAVRAFPLATVPYRVEEAGTSPDAVPFLKWTGTRGFDYAVEHSADLQSWQSGLTNSVFANLLTNTALTFSDGSGATQRAYRVRRSFSP